MRNGWAGSPEVQPAAAQRHRYGDAQAQSPRCQPPLTLPPNGSGLLDLDSSVHDVMESTVLVLLQASMEQILNLAWRRCRKCSPVRLPFEDFCDRVRDRLAGKRKSPAEHFV